MKIDQTFAHGLRHTGSEYKRGDEIEECGPCYSLPGRQNPRGNNRGYGIGGVVKAVDEIEDESNPDDRYGQQQGGAHLNCF